MLVSLDIGYSFMDPQNPNRKVVEPLLVCLLLGTLVLAAYLSWHHRRYLQQEVRAARGHPARMRISSIALPEEERLQAKDITNAAVELSTKPSRPRVGSPATGNPRDGPMVASVPACEQAGKWVGKSLVSAGI